MGSQVEFRLASSSGKNLKGLNLRRAADGSELHPMLGESLYDAGNCSVAGRRSGIAAVISGDSILPRMDGGTDQTSGV